MYLKHFCLAILKKEFIALLAIGLFMFGIVTVGNATTYNAFADFSTISSSGVWSYGEGTTGSNFLLLNRSLSDFSEWGCTDIHGWVSSQGWRDSGFPMVAKKTGIVGERPCDFGATIPGDLLVVAPAGNSTRSDAIIQWKAPATAVYNVSWTFARENNYNTDGIRTLVFKNSTKVYELVLGPGQQTTSSQTLSLNVGDVLSFGVNDVSWGNGDTSGFNAIITSTPTPQPVVSGSVKTASGAGVSGVTITFSNSGETATTDASGNYSVTVANGYSGTATPSQTGYTFSPATKSYSNLTTNQTGQDYTATPPPVVVSGSVKTAFATGVSGVLITFSNSGGTATTDGSGNYSITVPNGYTGTATPSKTGYTFSPATRAYSSLTANQTGQDYTATLPPVVVSGSVKTASATGVSGVLITFSNSGGTATTDASGNYSVTLPNGYSGTATPSKTGYTFSPATRTYSNLTTNQTGQDYTATPPAVVVSGSIKTASATGVSGVLITFSNSGGTATTDASGYYSVTVANGYSGTATPSKTGYTFSPTTRTYSSLTTDQTGQDYTATLPTVVVSGSVKTASGAGVSGVLITFSNSGGSVTTDGSGNYSITVPNGYTGTATPSKARYTFSPATRTYSSLTTNQTGQDYIGTPIAPTISGSVKTLSGTAISGVLITFSNGGGTATTDVSGSYSVTVPINYSGMATPSKTGYTFEPASKSYSSVTTPKTGENYVGTPIPNPTVGSNSIDAIDVIKITDMSGLLPDAGGAVTVKAWDKNGKQLTSAGYASPLSVLNHGTTSIRGADLEIRFPDGAPAAYSFSVESSKMFITNVNNSIDGAVKVPIIYSNGLSNFVSNSIGPRNTLKLTDMSGTIGSAGIAITVTAWDASGKAIPESTSATSLKLYSHGTTTIAGSSLAARFLPGVPVTYEFTIASPKLVISNVKNSSDGTLNIPSVYTVGVSSFVSNSIGSRNTIYISDFSGALDIGGAAIIVRAWDEFGTEIAESDSLSSYKIFNYETVKITGAELASRFSSGVPMTYEFTVDSSNVVITNIKSSSDGNINIPTVYTSGITKYTTNYVSDLNTIQITDMSGGLPSGGGSITIIARDGIGTLIPESGSATALKLINHGTTTIEGIDLRNRFPGGTPVTYEFSIGSSSAVVTNLTESRDGTINIPAVFTLGPYGGI